MHQSLQNIENYTKQVTKKLVIGDKLHSEGSWSDIVVHIISVSETEAISDKGYCFQRNFTNGDSYIKADSYNALDFYSWLLIE